MQLSESPRHCVFGDDIAFAVVFGGFLSFGDQRKLLVASLFKRAFQDPAWHRNLRRRRAFATLSLARGKGTSVHVAQVRLQAQAAEAIASTVFSIVEDMEPVFCKPRDRFGPY